MCCLNFHRSSPQPQWHPVSRLEVGDIHVVHCVIVHPSLELSVCLLEEVGGEEEEEEEEKEEEEGRCDRGGVGVREGRRNGRCEGGQDQGRYVVEW